MTDIAVLLNTKERVNIEAKAAAGGIPNSIWETYSSFANTFGGTIILGVEEDKETKALIPKGIKNPDQLISDIWNTVKYSLQGTTQGRYLTGGVPPVRFSM